MAHCVVTGAAGFIGSSVVDALLARGVTVVGIDRRGRGDLTAEINLHNAFDHPGFDFLFSDIASDSLDTAISGADVVFHLAAVPGVRDSWGSRFDDYLRSNICATGRLLTACRASGVRRFVYASSSSVYGNTCGPCRESDPTCPISPYGVTKLAGEQLALAYARRFDAELSVVALRYFTVYGPRQRPEMLINQILLSCLADMPVNIFGDGSQRREYTYIDDVVAATLASADIDVEFDVINIGGGSHTSVADVINTAEQVTGRPTSIVRMGQQPGDVALTCADHGHAQQVLGYRPSGDLREGIARQSAWLASVSEGMNALLTTRTEHFR